MTEETAKTLLIFKEKKNVKNRMAEKTEENNIFECFIFVMAAFNILFIFLLFYFVKSKSIFVLLFSQVLLEVSSCSRAENTGWRKADGFLEFGQFSGGAVAETVALVAERAYTGLSQRESF